MRTNSVTPVRADALELAIPASLAFGVCAGFAGSAHADSTVSTTKGADPEVDELVVHGMRPLEGTKLPATIRETPQSLDVISKELLRSEAADRLSDALKNVPGITFNAGEGAARGDTVNLRGFSAFNDFFLDGIRDAAVYGRDSFDLEALEVLKGPSASLFGRGSTGGVINQVSKAPTLASIGVVTGEFGTNDEQRGTLDVGGQVTPGVAVRLNAMIETSGVADRDGVRNNRWGVAPSVAFGLGKPTTLVLSYLHQQEDNTPDVGVPFVNGRPAPVPRGADFGLASDRNVTHVDIFTGRLKRDFGEAITVTDTVRYGHYGYYYIFDAPNFGGAPPTASTPLSSILVGRDSPSSTAVQTELANQLDLTLRFRTGPLSHHLVVGFEAARENYDIGRFNNPFNRNNGWIPPTPLLDPDPTQARPAQPITSRQITDAYSSAVYLTDTIGVGRYFDLITGARYDRFAASYNQTSLVTGAVLGLDHVDHLTSPRVALVYKPTSNASVYFSYGTSFDPSAEALTLTTRTANLGPVEAYTLEAGAKATVLGGGLLATGAVFRTVVDNAQTNDPDNPTVTILNGNQRVEGFELGLSGHITHRLEITAGYTYLDGTTLASGNPLYVGKAMPNVAPNAVNLWAEYYPADGWEVGLGGNYLDTRFADSAQTAKVPSYIVVNAMASRRLARGLTIQLNLNNLFDKRYYDGVYYTSVSENHTVPGPGRTLKATLKASF
jgi:catecholate siderophore receptor